MDYIDFRLVIGNWELVIGQFEEGKRVKVKGKRYGNKELF
jgi:hypothetical protein